MDTKSVQEIGLSRDILEEVILKERKTRIQRGLEPIQRMLKEYETLVKNDWIKIENKNVYVIASEKLIILDPTRADFEYENIDRWIFEGYTGRPMNTDEVVKLFWDNKSKNPLIKKDCICGQGERIYTGVAYNKDNYYAGYRLRISDGYRTSDWRYNDIIKIPVYMLKKKKSILENIVEEELIPFAFDKVAKEKFRALIRLYKEKKIKIFNESEIRIEVDFEDALLNGKYNDFEGISLKESDILKYIEQGKIKLDDTLRALVAENLLTCDTIRAKIEPYDMKRLEDPNMGHWELWQTSKDSKRTKIKCETPLVARNPLADIKEDGIVGIDFGTKSTIVAYQDGDEYTRLMRIGRGDFRKKIQSKDYENPTVMEFIDLESFLKAYKETAGRPYTKWEDLTISHTAAQALLATNTNSNEYYSFFNDLKQWSGDKSRQIRIRDKRGHEYVLPAFVESKSDALNPIEIYAYYLGLFINNMYNGIYLNYMLSFPVTYEKAVREKILKSFETGLKKSLPETVLEDKESMEKFRVLQGASEPAAYAICALQEYGFEPDEDESIFYGIFDFGGGTTDFDFGIWRGASPKERRYDYVITHFGAGGDQYLGGENLLELLAFEVFKANKDKLLEQQIAFYKPIECKPFAGSETLLSNSQEAKLNTKQLMEKLRPIWEREEGFEKKYANNTLKVMLFDQEGNPKPNFELEIDLKKIQEVLTNRIEKGVKNFFEALKLTFNFENTKEMDQIHIFLAGNSSKSPIVKELFNKYIAERNKAINEIVKNEGVSKGYFKIYPPLGTKQAIEIQTKKGIKVDTEAFDRPTGKTGVAYGLLEGRPGSRIKVVSEKKSTDEVKFNFYIGYNQKKKFKVVIDREIEYGKWTSFIDAGEIDFEFYYTNLPEATSGQVPIGEVKKKICRIDQAYEDADVYIRAVAPSIIEYAVANEESLANEKTISKVTRVELE